MCKETAVPSIETPSGHYTGGTEETHEHGGAGNEPRTSKTETKRADTYTEMDGD